MWHLRLINLSSVNVGDNRVMTKRVLVAFQNRWSWSRSWRWSRRCRRRTTGSAWTTTRGSRNSSTSSSSAVRMRATRRAPYS